MNATNPNSVLIIGAGPSGLCLAQALAAHGLKIDIIDRQPAMALAAPAFDGREIALSHGSMRILKRLKIWDQIPGPEIHPLRQALVSDGSRAGFTVDAAPFGKDRLGNLVSNHVIRAAAWRAVQNSSTVRIHAGAEVKTISHEEKSFVVRLNDGRHFSAPLVVAADSRFSQMRRQLGVPAVMHDFGKTMLVCRMHHKHPHKSVAHEWFGRGQTRALLPLDEHTVSLVLTVTGAEAASLQDMDEPTFTRDMEARLDSRLGAMRLASTRHVYPLVATWAKRFAGPGFALVGDAAVGMHPMTAHGFNLGLASGGHLATAIGEALAQNRCITDASILARYQRRHRATALPIFLGTGLIVGLYTDDRAPMQPLRATTISGMRKLRPLRNAMAAAVMDMTLSETLLSMLRGAHHGPERTPAV